MKLELTPIEKVCVLFWRFFITALGVILISNLLYHVGRLVLLVMNN
jgi:hypothetical protein